MNMNYPSRGSEFGYEDDRLKNQMIVSSTDKKDKVETKKERKNLDRTVALILAAAAYFGPAWNNQLARYVESRGKGTQGLPDAHKVGIETAEVGNNVEVRDVKIEKVGDEVFVQATVEVGLDTYEVKVANHTDLDADIEERKNTVTIPDTGEKIASTTIVTYSKNGSYTANVFVKVSDGLMVRTKEFNKAGKEISTHSTIFQITASG